MPILIFAIIFGILGAGIASGKGRNPLIWFVVCTLFPAIGLIILLFQSNLKADLAKQLQAQRRQEQADLKECPRCAETVKLRATVCRHCGHIFEPASESNAPSDMPDSDGPSTKSDRPLLAPPPLPVSEPEIVRDATGMYHVDGKITRDLSTAKAIAKAAQRRG
ncbi:zinc ribbon domain-containing protein [Prosthecodimorpha staleyi]|uniref:Zinc ribbon domain-containing protein n=1 Tax=Prosthecodimorpha staleyi TaxID=2840188 RepID=A0A947D4U5_9HYPH|nr:zinc ribbon domain-containing protein [Prosthecodimorpha staleyi]MBT9289586.1 zinc ribbon domain-containing protein [Prosthecodimorpha staleyi]